ncbi:MAG: ATP-binding protein, partial [bacterium]|nr:ATP-binding protein [bacterium]
FDVNAIRNTMLTPQSLLLKRDGSNLHYILERAKKDPHLLELIDSSLTGIVSEVIGLDIEEQPMGTDKIPEIIFRERNSFAAPNNDKPGDTHKKENTDEVRSGKHSKGFPVARHDISDGTLSLLAILTALYTGQLNYLTAIEEPERHLHMSALSYLMEIFREYATTNQLQLVITTQSSEILRYVEPQTDNLVFIYREHDGNTRSVAARDIEEIGTLMKEYQYNFDEIVRNDILGYLGDHEQEK